MIPHSRPALKSVDLDTWGEMLDSGHLARGVFCRRLESLFTEKILGKTPQTFRSHALQSGTTALHLGLWGLKILRAKQGQDTERLEVITSTLTCAALVHAIHAVGAKPILCDTDIDGNLDVSQVAQRISSNTLAIIVPHMYGKPIEIKALIETGTPVFEDCAQTLGVDTGSGRVGTQGRLMMTSFYATKPICTGQGGLISSVDSELMEEIEKLTEYDGRSDPGPGWNGNLSDWSAALAIPQIESFAQSLKRRKAIADFYTEAFRNLPDRLVLPTSDSPDGHGWYRYVVLVPEDSTLWERRLEELGVEVKRPVFLPQHRIFSLPGDFPIAEEHWKRSLSIPIYPNLTNRERDHVVESVLTVCNEI